MRTPDLLKVDEVGLACHAGGFHIDPWAGSRIAVITHAHSDHARPGSGMYYCAEEGAALLRHRLPPSAKVTAVPFGQPFTLGGVRVSFHPAGHVRGSAQIRVEGPGGVWVVSGDYKRQPDPTCTPFEIVQCDVFITEATFALPIYSWDPIATVVREIADWWWTGIQRGRPSALFCYGLGKLQRLLAELWALRLQAGYEWIAGKAVHLHGAMLPLTDLYRSAGVDMMPTSPIIVPEDRKHTPGAFAGELICAPPSAAGTRWMRRFGPDCETGFASGWMRVRGVRRRRGYDRGFVVSDHADWGELLATIRQTRAKRIIATHGLSEPLTRYVREQMGLECQILETAYTGDEGVGPGEES